MIGTSIVVHVCFLISSGCSSQGSTDDLAIDLIDEAIEAVNDQFDPEAAFYEINATPDGVNMFVSVTGEGGSPAVVQARYTSTRGLVVSEDAVAADGAVFPGSAVDFDPDSILDVALEQLSSTQPRVFIITATSFVDGEQRVSDRVDYRLVMESDKGGRLVVLLGRDGSVLGSDVLD